MNRRKRRRREDDEPAPVDSGTVLALQQADPQDRARTLLQLQRTHGNEAVQRIIRALETTDAGRDARIQAIGDRAEEPVPSGRLDKARLYREAVAAELDASPAASRTERELVQDNVNTIGQIFANHQSALHSFEEAVTSGGLGERVPRQIAQEVLREVARQVFEPVLDACAGVAPGLEDHVAGALGTVDDVPEAEKLQTGQSAPAHALRNLVIAERHRVATTHRRLMKGQRELMDRAGDRADLAAAAARLAAFESGTHSAGGILKLLLDRWHERLRGRAEVSIVLDEQWNVVRAHIAAPDGRRLARELLAGGAFDLNDLHLYRHVTWQPAELATCRAVIAPDGRPLRFERNEKGGAFVPDFERRLRVDGLPRTRVLTGD